MYAPDEMSAGSVSYSRARKSLGFVHPAARCACEVGPHRNAHEQYPAIDQTDTALLDAMWPHSTREVLPGFVPESSVSVPSVPGIKAEVRRRTLEECKALAQQALAQDTAADVRVLVPLEF